MNVREVLLTEILPVVEKPSRYVGTEFNSTHKDPSRVDLRIALVFPDLYDMALGNLGLLILYSILNRLPWCWCERAYAPAPDLEAALRKRGLPLFVHESKDPLSEMDLIGFTLQSELTYTNILTILDLAGLPLRTEQRSRGGFPLVCAGGPAVFNPEPLAAFIDFFVIGDGEDVTVEVAECLRVLCGKPRREKLEALGRIEGIYVPELYPFEELPDGRILPVEGAPKVMKRVVRDLDGAPFPTDYIVPFTHQVHDRVGLEVLRGCTHGCRFCQAGMVTRPVRERGIETVDALMQETLDNTGYEEVSLVSLSTCDYSRVRTLVERVADQAHRRDVSVALPSLRLDSFSVELADMITGVRRTGLTFAPEAASPRLRAVINKWIPDEELLDMSAEAFRLGWNHVKTYFMIGLPTECDDDVQAIVDLCVRTLDAGREVNPKARVHTGVSTFVPKPFTPFQWAGQIPLDEAYRRQDILRKGFARHPGIKFGRHRPEATLIEGLITRADRRAADLIEAAWRRGARFESWDEQLNFTAWQEAIAEVEYDVDGALRERDPGERLPWDHLDVLIPKRWLQEDWQRAQELKHAQDCRHYKCLKCGVIDRDRPLCAEMLRRSIKGAKAERDWRRKELPKDAEPPAAQRLRFRIGRQDEARLLSHLELMNAWTRALRRAQAPLSQTQGFHAHPRVNFASAPPVGEESLGDYMDVLLRKRVRPEALLSRLQSVLPAGFRAFDVKEVPLKAPSLMSVVTGFSYSIYPSGDPDEVRSQVDKIRSAQELVVRRRSKKKRGRGGSRPDLVSVDVRPMIHRIEMREENGDPVVDLETRIVDGKGVRLRELLTLLGVTLQNARVVKRDTHLNDECAAGESAGR